MIAAICPCLCSASPHRDYDFGPKKIIGARNIPKDSLMSSANDNEVIRKLIEECKEVENVIFHCMYSQVRGPASAKHYSEFRRKYYPKHSKQDVLILQGGFAFWKQQHAKLCEDI